MKSKLSTAAFMLGAILSISILSAVPGCSNGDTPPAGTGATQPVVNQALILSAITSAAEIATNTGLRALAKNNPAAAAETAAALQKSITGDLLPYLAGGKIGTSAEVHDLLNSSLFVNVNPALRNAIAVAAALLDAYLPAPSASTYLSANQVAYVTAFLTGISKGCVDFNTKALNGPRWIEPAE